jgi:uncharacterized protein
MKLENNFTIDAPVEKAWEALNSPETVAPCFPGATLTEYEGDSFTGTVKVKLGPIAMTYKGKGTYVTRDEAAHEVVIDASGRDSRGNGTATAKVTASLAADGPDKTAVSMVTDMTITGKPAQFGRGVISDVADKIIGQFSACVARKLGEGESTESSASSESTSAASSKSTAGSAGEAVVPVSAAAAQATGGAPAPTVAAAKSPSTSASPAEPPGTAGTSEAAAPAASTLAPGSTGEPTASGPAETAKPAADGAPSTNGVVGSAAGTSAPGTSEAEAPAATTMPIAASPATTPAAASRPASRGPVRSEIDAIDLFDTAGAPVLKRLAPVGAGALFLVLVILLVRRLRAS